ncbi:MAG: zf-HC2 domain-containing protein [Anaerolineae bacterium]|nr:zf-HC2 domain-containing protein [Anaerolineae bacterium]
MTTPLTEQDLILLNAYLDDELSARERTAFEARLAEEGILQAELESLRVTSALLGMAQRVRVPRNFTLDPAVYSKPKLPGWWATLRIPSLATVGVTILSVLCVGALIIRMGFGGAAMTSAPEAAEIALDAASGNAVPVTEVPPEAPHEHAVIEESGEEMGEPTEIKAPAALPLPTLTMGRSDNGLESDQQATDKAASDGVGTQPGSETDPEDMLSEQRSATTAQTVGAAEPPQTAGEYDGTQDTASSIWRDDVTQSQSFTMSELTATSTTDEQERGGNVNLSGRIAVTLIGIIILACLLLAAGVAVKRRHK